MKVIIGVLLAAVLVLTSCSFTSITGGTVASDACSDLQGAAKDNCYFEELKCSKIEKHPVPRFLRSRAG